MTINQEKADQLIRDLSGIHTLAEMIKIYYLNSIKDTRFRKPKIQGKATKIQEFAHSIQTQELKDYLKVKKEYEEVMADEHCLQLWRILDHFLFADTKALEEFADALEKNEI